MISKIRTLIIFFILVMLLSEAGCGLNLLLGGIGQDEPCVEPCSSAANYKYKDMAASLDADYFPMYYDDDELDNIVDVKQAATGKATDQNGLNNDAVHGKTYNTILAYSGGTATALTVLANYKKYGVTCDTLILVSPMSAGISDELLAKIRKNIEEDCHGSYSCLNLLDDLKPAADQTSKSYASQVRAMLKSDPAVVNNIIVITSPQDELMPYVSNIFQVRDFEKYAKEKAHWYSSDSDINPNIAIITHEEPLTQYEDDGVEAHKQLFFKYAKTHLSITDDGAIKFNPEDNPIKEPNRGTAPTVQAFDVTPLDLNVGGSFEIDYTVSDSSGSGLKQVELWRKDEQSDWQEIKRNELSGENGPTSGSFTDSPSASGKYRYGLHVVDNAGNWNDEKNSNTNGQPNHFEPVEVEVIEVEKNGATIDEVANVVLFPDPNLEAAIREAINKPEGAIYASDLEELKGLDASDREIRDITGLEYCTNLQMLGLFGNQISDISSLSGLTNLQYLILESNPITDISPLAGLTNLQELYLSQLTGISPPEKYLQYQIPDENKISDVSPLAGLTNLQNLKLGANLITDISPLAGLTNLQELYLAENQISDVSPLAGLTNLQKLSLFSNQITDISPLAGLTNLQVLDLAENQISDFSPLAGLTNLQLSGVEYQISDVRHYQD
jgi:Leucine-rich repeat (LRR) protein